MAVEKRIRLVKMSVCTWFPSLLAINCPYIDKTRHSNPPLCAHPCVGVTPPLLLLMSCNRKQWQANGSQWPPAGRHKPPATVLIIINNNSAAVLNRMIKLDTFSNEPPTPLDCYANALSRTETCWDIWSRKHDLTWPKDKETWRCENVTSNTSEWFAIIALFIILE